jgi:hypothetical protein
MSKLKEIEAEIKKAKELFKVVEDYHIGSSKNMKDLERIVMNIHYILDQELNLLIPYRILSKVYDEEDIGSEETMAEQAIIFSNIWLTVDTMNYRQKVQALENIDEAPKAQIQLLKLVNTVRNQFAHRRTSIKELQEYEDKEKYMDLLDKLQRAFLSVDTVVTREVEPLNEKFDEYLDATEPIS